MSSRYIEIFLRESASNLSSMQQGLLTLEKEPENSELLKDLLRKAHTVKGSARMIGFEEIGSIAHLMEDGFKEVISGSGFSGSFPIERFLQGCDAITRLVDAVGRGDYSPAEASAALDDFRNNRPASQGSRRENLKPEEPGSAAASVTAPIAKLDSIINLAGELIISSQRFQRKLDSSFKELSKLLPEGVKTGELRAIEIEWDDELLSFSSLVQQVHSETLSLRMLPLSTITGGFLRSVRDLSKELGKEVRFVVSGENVELDREILENLRPLVLHLITNALAHGIESPAERVSLGKPSEGLVALSATLLGEMVRVTVRDDGRGVDASEIRAKAVRMGFIDSAAADAMSEEEAIALVLNHGFSTVETLTEVAGRGVGMDVVNSGVCKLKGYLKLNTVRGKFFEAAMTIPVTLSIIESLLVSCSGEVFAVPVSYVQEIVRIRVSDLIRCDGMEQIVLNGARVRTVALNDLLGLPGGCKSRYRVSMTAMVLRVDDKLLACVVDAVVGETEAVVKSFPRQVDDIGNFLGVTILADGAPSFILNVNKLFSGTFSSVSHNLLVSENLEIELSPRILVVDDSITSRSIISTILETRGFRVETAESGDEALKIISGSSFDLLISDVEMPGMNGYDLLRKVRSDMVLKGVPAILVSSLGSEEDRQRALDSGAMAYMVKGEFDQELLLKIVSQLFGGVKNGKENSDH